MLKNPCYIVAVSALIFRQKKVLAMRRSPQKDAGAGLWECLSGRVDSCESPLDAVKREILEESGLTVKVDPRPFTAYQAKRNQDPMMVIVYLAHHQSGEVILSPEHDEFAWLSPAEFAQRCTFKALTEAALKASRTLY